MCDTQVLIDEHGVWFAKNSDREPSEAQAVIRLPAVYGDKTSTLHTTYLEIGQVPDRHSVILSKPHWMWGAEIGANDAGVVIGNEAIFSKLRTLEPGLLGMDLLRLGLERGATAREAMDVITWHLEKYGQGGPAGFRDKKFHYDNSFIIADPMEAWVLETAGRVWVAKRVSGSHAISNCLTIGTDYDVHAENLEVMARTCGHVGGKVDFARTFDTKIMPYFAGSHQRVVYADMCLFDRKQTGASLAGMMSHLRMHAAGNEDPTKGSKVDICMHAAGPIRRSQTCGSMISHLSKNGNEHLLTGTSAPCLSLFRPIAFDSNEYSVISKPNADVSETLWRRFEPIHRRALFETELRNTLRLSRDQAQRKILELLEGGTRLEADVVAREWESGLAELASTSKADKPLTVTGALWRHLDRIDGFV